MTIQINIQDITKLSKDEIELLNRYLLDSLELRDKEISQAINVLRENQTDDQAIIDALVNIDTLLNKSTEPTPKKKRTTKPKPDLPISQVPVDLPINQLVQDIANSITAEEVVMFVLENIREKKISFETVTDILKEFEIPNLNTLATCPDAVAPVYTRILNSLNS